MITIELNFPPVPSNSPHLTYDFQELKQCLKHMPTPSFSKIHTEIEEHSGQHLSVTRQNNALRIEVNFDLSKDENRKLLSGYLNTPAEEQKFTAISLFGQISEDQVIFITGHYFNHDLNNFDNGFKEVLNVIKDRVSRSLAFNKEHLAVQTAMTIAPVTYEHMP